MKDLNLNQLSTSLVSHKNEILSSVKDIVSSKKHRGGRPSKLSIDQIYECILLKSEHSIGYWKCVFKLYQKQYPNTKLPVYKNCLNSVYKFFKWLIQVINLILFENRNRFLNSQVKIAFVDSTPLPVCKIQRSSRHKTMKDQAQFSKGTMGWYYGFKLHLVLDYTTNLPIYITFTQAKTDDRLVLKELMKGNDNNGLNGLFYNSGTMFVADKGYQSKELEQVAYNTGNYLLTGKRQSKNMKTLASWFDIYLLHHRARVETPFSKLKGKYNLVSTKARSTFGYIFNYVFSIFSLVNESR
jgi:Transposase DDE domain